MNMAAAVYHHTLWREPRALAYLRERGIPDWVIRRCWLGYADGDSLERFLRPRRGLEVAQDLGLLQRPRRRGRTRPLRDVLAGRIVVPELRGGQTIWMIGRSLDESPSRPKYLALGGERPVLGFERAVGRKEAILCEGVFDYLTAVSWGLPAFSPCGTHIPAERLGFLARAERVFGVFDGDAAGDEAAARFGAQLGERWRPLRLPDGTDLNDLGRRPHGRDWFFRLLSAARIERPDGGASMARVVGVRRGSDSASALGSASVVLRLGGAAGLGATRRHRLRRGADRPPLAAVRAARPGGRPRRVPGAPLGDPGARRRGVRSVRRCRALTPARSIAMPLKR